MEYKGHGLAGQRVNHKRDGHDWPVINIRGSSQEYIRLECFEKVGKVADKMEILMDQNIIIQIREIKEQGMGINYKADNHKGNIWPIPFPKEFF